MAHLDLHFDNIFIRKNQSKGFKSYTYDIGNELQTSHIPDDIDIKIIDMDGAQKHDAGKRVRTVFKSAIRNKYMFGGTTRKINPRVNVMKVLFELHSGRYKINKSNISHLSNIKGRVPLFQRNIRALNAFKYRNKHLANKYGMMINNINNIIKFRNDILLHPTRIMKRIGRDFPVQSDVKIDLSKRFSQERIFRNHHFKKKSKQSQSHT
jgi:hypothetical protein